MKAVILAAGRGTRMGALTEELPKPMLPVEGKPILEHIITGIAAQGVREVCLIVGWKAEVIQKHFGDGSALGLNITYTTQEVQDGTGKAPELAREFVGNDAFLLTYGDILVRPGTYKQMIARFGEGDFSGLITVTLGEDVRKGGINFFDDDFCLQKIVEKNNLRSACKISYITANIDCRKICILCLLFLFWKATAFPNKPVELQQFENKRSALLLRQLCCLGYSTNVPVMLPGIIDQQEA